MAENYELKRHRNGIFYIHWSESRRTRRVTTEAVERRDAEIFRAKWVLSRLCGSAAIASQADRA